MTVVLDFPFMVYMTLHIVLCDLAWSYAHFTVTLVVVMSVSTVSCVGGKGSEDT